MKAVAQDPWINTTVRSTDPHTDKLQQGKDFEQIICPTHLDLKREFSLLTYSAPRGQVHVNL